MRAMAAADFEGASIVPRSILAPGILALGLLAGCFLVRPPEYSQDLEQSLPDIPQDWQMEALQADVLDGWAARFDDPHLLRVIAAAQAGNPNLRAAEAALRQARLLTVQAKSVLLPSVAAQASASVGDRLEGRTTNPDTYQFGVPVGYLLDVWGDVRAGDRAARADYDALRLTYRYARMALAAGVAKAYFVVKEAEQQIRIQQQSVDALARILELVRRQLAAGAATEQDFNVAQSDLASAESALLGRQQGARTARRALHVLLGRYPGDDLAIEGAYPRLPPVPAVGVPAALLERRPDLVAAERSVAAAFDRVHVAKVAWLPRINLSAGLRGLASAAAEVFEPESISWNLGTSLAAPVFQGGVVRSRRDAAEAAREAAIANYVGKALLAFNEVESLFDMNRVLAEREARLRVSVETAGNAHRVATLRYENGAIDLTILLENQRREYSRQSDLVALRRAQLEARVDLFLALGGDWEAVDE